jgi:hypothetical protein
MSLHPWVTPNGRKLSFLSEECRISHAVHPDSIVLHAEIEPSAIVALWPIVTRTLGGAA